MASILALSLAAGRFLAGQLVKKFHWTKLLTVCLLLAMGIVAFVLPRALDYQAAPVHKLWRYSDDRFRVSLNSASLSRRCIR